MTTAPEPTSPTSGSESGPASRGGAPPGGSRGGGPRREAPGVAPRRRAIERIAVQVRRFPDLDLAPLVTSDLPPRDASLAAAIDHAVARHWTSLRYLIEPTLRRGWHATPPPVLASLLAGAAQLLHFDRVPPHAAIDGTVGAAKAIAGPKAAGMVNAVLRKVQRMRGELVPVHDPARDDELPRADGSAWRLDGVELPPVVLDRIAVQTSHAKALIASLGDRFGTETAGAIARHGLVEPPVIAAGLAVGEDGRTVLPPLPPDVEGRLVAHDEPGFAVLEGGRPAIDALLHDHPHLRIQDATAAAAVAATARAGGLAARLDGGLAIDACAGRGTKSRQLRALHPTLRVVATDVDDLRRAALAESLAGDPLASVPVPVDLEAHRDGADLLVLDVPCSNTGVLARRVEARHRWSDEAVAGLVDLQRQIIADHLSLLKPDGWLLYATCSIDPRENEAQAAWVAEWHPFEVVEQAWTLPASGPGDPPAAYRDGGGYALLRRSGGD